ncbi:DUF2207 domain-containing protein [Hydrogenimonas sp.]|uniref:DUF2207 domain-containing protein n=1 Tax=Hydrogenimonas sp. TaxID=2231112 RepID=UPI00260352C2|nr:DUF2207 domain-containing protein [Hydrogenimonas sp.]
MRALLLFQLFAVFLLAEAIRHYDVTIDLHDDGSLDVKEMIEYDFGTVWKHGIFRDIPKMVTGRYGMRSIGLGGFSVWRDGKPEPFEKLVASADAGPMVRLRIGRGDLLLNGIHRYTIAYRVAHGILSMKDGRDALRWNAVGTGWKVPIGHARVTVRLPETLVSLPIESRTFSGPYGSTTTRAVLVKKAPDLYEATVDSLAPHEGLTVELAFARGTLGQSGDFDEGMWGWLKSRWPWIFLPLFTMALFVYWYRHGRDPSIGSIAPMYQPPKGIDPLQAGVLVDQFADTKDIAAAIIDLARMGYLTIKEESTENPLAQIPVVGKVFEGTQMVLLRKNKNANGLSPEYRIILDRLLFPYSDRFVLVKRSDERAKRFRDGYEKINGHLYEWSWKEGYMQENPSRARIGFLVKTILFLLPFLGIAAFQSAGMIGDVTLILPLLFVSLFFVAGLMLLIFQKDFAARFVASFFILVPLLIGYSILEQFGSVDTFLSLPFTIMLLAFFPILFFARFMGAYTRKGAALYRHLLGFKEFIKRVKEDELRRLLKRDPAYLDRALPYAMVFGVADHWLKFYDLLGASTPVWFEGNRNSLLHLDRSFGKFTETSQAGTSSGGTSGGGSFSGGGGGGGGGGSW